MTQWLSTYRAPVPDYGLSSLCGCGYWKSVFGACVPDPELDRQFSVPRTHAFFLYGAEGNGKRTLAGALAADLTAAGYLFAWIPGEDLAGETEAQAGENISALLEEIAGAAGADAAGVCVLIDDFQLLLEEKKTVRILERGLERLMNRQAPCVILGVAESREHYPARLEKLMLPCPIGLPDEKERREYLEQAMEGYLPHEHGLSYKKMAEMTEGLNYGFYYRGNVSADGGSSVGRHRADRPAPEFPAAGRRCAGERRTGGGYSRRNGRYGSRMGRRGRS